MLHNLWERGKQRLRAVSSVCITAYMKTLTAVSALLIAALSSTHSFSAEGATVDGVLKENVGTFKGVSATGPDCGMEIKEESFNNDPTTTVYSVTVWAKGDINATWMLTGKDFNIETHSRKTILTYTGVSGGGLTEETATLMVNKKTTIHAFELTSGSNVATCDLNPAG